MSGLSKLPAFPPPGAVLADGTLHGAYVGMTLRDYFAAAAIQGLLAQSCGTAYISSPEAGAEYAFRTADAMLKARQT